MRHWERPDPGWHSHLTNKSNGEKDDFPVNDTGWSKEKSQSIPNRTRTYGDTSRNTRIGDNDENSPNFDEYVMTKQRGSRKWGTLAKVWRMFLYGGYGSPLSVAILAKWNLGEMVNNHQCLNKNSNGMKGALLNVVISAKLMKMANMANNRQIIVNKISNAFVDISEPMTFWLLVQMLYH